MNREDLRAEATILIKVATMIKEGSAIPSTEAIKHMLALNNEIYRAGRKMNYPEEREEQEEEER